MLLPRLFATGLWLVATVVSTFMVWTATSLVAADVTDRPAPVVPHDEVVSELRTGSLSGQAAPTTAPQPLTSTPSAPPRGGGPLPASPDLAVPATPLPRAPRPGVTLTPFPSPSTVTTAPAAPPPSRQASPPTTLPPPRPATTYSTNGGVVRVACNGYFIELISAIPSNGYAAKVVAGGPANVDVHFVRSGEDLSVKVLCFGQPIRYYDQSPPGRPTGTP